MSGTPSEPIAIVGTACRFPGANDIEAFWRLPKAGGNAQGGTARRTDPPLTPSGRAHIIGSVEHLEAHKPLTTMD